MKILALTNLYPRPGHEGFAPFNRQQFQALSRAHDLRVIAPVPWTQALRERRAASPAPRSYRNTDGVRVDHPRFYFPPRVLRSSYGTCYAASVRGSFDRAVGESRPDVLLACWAHPDGWAAVRLGRRAGLPVVIKVVGTDLMLASDPGRWKKIAEALKGAGAVVAVSHDLADRAARLGVEPDRIRVVPECLDVGLFHPGDQGEARTRLGLPADAKVLLFVGNLLFSKGAGLVIEACRGLAARVPGFRCVLAGGGPDGPALRAAAARIGVADVVTFVGPRPHAELPDWYRASDVVTLPSYSEGLPNVLREAIACGRPFVATRVGGIPELARPEYSRLVPPGSPGLLAEAVVEMFSAGPSAGVAAAAVRQAGCEESAALLAECLGEAAARFER